MKVEKKENLLPNLILAGAAKSGTTSLHSCLDQHPDIFMCNPKEPNFFSHDNVYAKGFDYYEGLFSSGVAHQVRGESSVSYMASREAIDRMKSALVSPKYIFLLRNPIDRAYSHYWWLRGMGFETSHSFEEAFKRDMGKVADEVVFNVKRDFYYRAGCYGKYITRYIEAFGRENVLIVTTDEYRKNSLDLVNKCFTFLGLKPLDNLEELQKNKTVQLKNPKLYQSIWFAGQSTPAKLVKKCIPNTWSKALRKSRKSLLNKIFNRVEAVSYPKVSAEERQWLAEAYMDEVSLLRQVTGESFEDWNGDFPVAIKG